MNIKSFSFIFAGFVFLIIGLIAVVVLNGSDAFASQPAHPQQDSGDIGIQIGITDTPTEPVKLTDTPTEPVKLTDTPTQPYPFPTDPVKITDTPTQPYPFPTFPQPTEPGPRPHPGGPGNLPYVIGFGGLFLFLFFFVTRALRQKPI